jgi:hypothetical protein
MAARKTHDQTKEPRTASSVVRELFDAMRRQRVTIMQMAVALDMTSTGLSYWKSGRSTPDIVMVELFAAELGYRLALVPIEEAREDARKL